MQDQLIRKKIVLGSDVDDTTCTRTNYKKIWENNGIQFHLIIGLIVTSLRTSVKFRKSLSWDKTTRFKYI